ncbi:MAG: hypothetical protein AAB433_22695 [Nitrospirota bacterium]
MVTAILSQEVTDLNSPGLNAHDRPSEIVIRVGLDGFRGAEIIADEFDTQDKLLQLWASIHPALEAELDRTFNDNEFIAIAERTGVKI